MRLSLPQSTWKNPASQTFRLDYRLRRPDTLLAVFVALASKTTLRKTARSLGVGRSHVVRRFARLAHHCHDFHAFQLARARERGGLGSSFQFDELETYEEHRKLKPLTVPVLIEETTGFIVSTEVATLPARGHRNAAEEAVKARYEAAEGVRRSGSVAAVASTVDALVAAAATSGPVHVTTDKKASYRSRLRRALGERLVHRRIDGRAQRGSSSPLFPINHTLARLRDLLSRLVRQTWAASKRRARLGEHLDVVVAFRNYVDGWRSEPAARQRVSAAQQLGLCDAKIDPPRFLTWRDPLVAVRG